MTLTRVHVCRVGVTFNHSGNHSGNSTNGQSSEETLVSLCYLTTWSLLLPVCLSVC